jgi:hypothetical protein
MKNGNDYHEMRVARWGVLCTTMVLEMREMKVKITKSKPRSIERGWVGG